MRSAIFSLALCLAGSGITFSQTPEPDSDALVLLKSVTEHYAGAKTYSVAASEEITQTSDYQRTWSKSELTAAEAPGGRYRFQGRGNMGSAIRVSDGKTVWKYHAEENHYTAEPVNTVSTKSVVPVAELALLNAQYLRANLAGLARSIHSASFAPEETLTIDGNPMRLTVIHIRDSDEIRPDPNASRDETIWIDRQKQTVMKIEDRQNIKRIPGNLSILQVTTRIYTHTELDGPLPEHFFTFAPPVDALLVAKFPDPRDSYGLPTMAGDTIPALKFESADGKVVPIESFRGKPVLIDFWATWCAPCVAAMPNLEKIYKQGKDKGLVLLSVDQDESASKAAGFLAKKGYSWQNFHDVDGAIAKLMGSTPIPRAVLIDARGTIVYDGTGADEDRLRTHLSELGPEFRDLASKTNPCDVAAQSH